MNNRTASTPDRQWTLTWVAADDLQVNPVAQREFRPAHAEAIYRKFDIDKFQVPYVNRRDGGQLFILEGQHGTWAYRQWLGDDQKIQVWLSEGLTEEEEAEFFLSLNDKKTVDAMSKFKVAVTAGRETEAAIDRIVRASGCSVGNRGSSDTISAVGTLLTIFNRHGGDVLRRTLDIIRGAYVEGGYERPVLMGIAMVLARYPDVNEARLVKQLAAVRSGWKGLIQATTFVREQMNVAQPEAAAASVVDLYNKGRGGKKLPTWWHADLKAVA